MPDPGRYALRDEATRALPGRSAGADDALEHGGERARWVCAACGTKITDPSAVFGPGGAPSVQVFTNPAGKVCRVMTVLRAESLLLAGPAVSEYSWFPGWAWRIALCARCGAHLGWRFEAEAGGSPPLFFGLLVSALVERRD
jgi:hypothetical protein